MKPRSLFSSLAAWIGGLLPLLWVHMESENLLLPALLVMSIVLLPVAAVAFLMATRRPEFSMNPLRFRAGFILTLNLAFIPLALWLQDWQDDLTRQRATSIIQALEAYHRRQASYPDSLSQLVPQYLPAVPATALGGLIQDYPFYYTVISKAENPASSFSLSYSLGMMVDATYSSSSHQWSIDD